jgi:Bifunctional DNA primase/polymerase, N-terminal/Primase C terminal 1 (PriCT-1)
MAAFQDAAREYADAGIVPLPIDGKRPLVKHPDRFRRRAALSIVPKFPNAALGFWCGHFNRLTVVDIDSPADTELQYALDTFGPSPIIVRTASGKHHAYYRHDGERRRIRPIPGHAIDILGEGGIAVAPPSTGTAGGRYEFVRGGLADIAAGNLPRIRRGALQKLEPAPSMLDIGIPTSTAPNAATIDDGQRNDRLFKLVCALAHQAETQDALLQQSREANAALCNPPLSDDEVQGRVRSAWRYKMQGRLMVPGMESAILLPRASLSSLLSAGETDAWALLGLFQSSHGVTPGKLFAASPAAMERDRCIGRWDRHRYRNAIRKLCDLGELEQVYSGGKGPHDPAMYRLRPLAKGGKSPPNLNQTLPPSLPALRQGNQKRHFRVLAKEQSSRLGQFQNMRQRGELR